MRKWEMNINQNILKPTLKFNTVWFADDLVIIVEHEENLQNLRKD
jgi:hypothetical protein